jgi:hypothetical protein
MMMDESPLIILLSFRKTRLRVPQAKYLMLKGQSGRLVIEVHKGLSTIIKQNSYGELKWVLVVEMS